MGGRRERVEEGSLPLRAVKAKNRSWPEAPRERESQRRQDLGESFNFIGLWFG